MQEDEDVLAVLSCFGAAAVPPDMEARILCSCRSNMFKTSGARRRRAFHLATICSLANVALGLITIHAHRRHVRLKTNLYGG